LIQDVEQQFAHCSQHAAGAKSQMPSGFFRLKIIAARIERAIF
jgi:hypothetical protein